MKKIVVSVLFIIIIPSLIGLSVFGQRGVIHLKTVQKQLAKLESDNERLKTENRQLKNEIELLTQNLSYIEDIARKELGLVKKGELVYQLKPNDQTDRDAIER